MGAPGPCFRTWDTTDVCITTVFPRIVPSCTKPTSGAIAMFLPETYQVTLALMILSMLCWGSWAITLKVCAY
jgi:hypothetical protein